MQKQLDDLNKRIKGEVDQKNNIVAQQGKVHQDANRLRDEVKTLETSLTNNEDDKTTKDNQIRTLREELAHQEDMIGKLQKEKRSAGDSKQKVEESKREKLCLAIS